MPATGTQTETAYDLFPYFSSLKLYTNKAFRKEGYEF